MVEVEGIGIRGMGRGDEGIGKSRNEIRNRTDSTNFVMAFQVLSKSCNRG